MSGFLLEAVRLQLSLKESTRERRRLGSVSLPVSHWDMCMCVVKLFEEAREWPLVEVFKEENKVAEV